jgi:hypothetical protein
LAQHAWSDGQLMELEQTLKSINFLADFQFAMRCEIAQMTTTLDYFKRASQSDLRRLFCGLGSNGYITLAKLPWPGGWWNQNKSRLADFDLQSLANVDSQARLVFPKGDAGLQNQIEQEKAKWDAWGPWKILANVSAGPVIHATQQYARGQVGIDEARIACALERYRLAHGVYPDKLEALAPGCIDELPHDIMNGEAYRYRLNADGTFQLYSVGWNQVDDGGKVVFKKDAPTQVDYEEGDWVWPVAKGVGK